MQLDFQHEPKVEEVVKKVVALIQQLLDLRMNGHDLVNIGQRLSVYYAFLGERCANYCAEREYLKHERKKAYSRAFSDLMKSSKQGEATIMAEDYIEKERMDEATAIFRHQHLKYLLDSIDKNLISIALRRKIQDSEQKQPQGT